MVNFIGRIYVFSTILLRNLESIHVHRELIESAKMKFRQKFKLA